MTSIWQIAAIQIGNFSAFFGLQSAISGHLLLNPFSFVA